MINESPRPILNEFCPKCGCNTLEINHCAGEPNDYLACDCMRCGYYFEQKCIDTLEAEQRREEIRQALEGEKCHTKKVTGKGRTKDV